MFGGGGGGLDDYRPITLLNTELKILARVLTNRLQLVISDLIGPEQNYSLKGRSIQDKLHLVRQILEGKENDTEAALINLDQSKAFDRVDYRFLATVLETAGFERRNICSDAAGQGDSVQGLSLRSWGSKART